MSRKLVTKEIPDILPVSRGDLNRLEVWRLLNQCDSKNRVEFVVCKRGRETILINEELPNIEETTRLINKIMAVKYLNKADLFDQFKKLHGEDASNALLYIWLDWRNERRAVDLNKRAADALSEIKRSGLTKKARKEKDIIKELFDIGFGLYDGEAKCDWEKGAQNSFLYGYMLGRESAVKKGGAAHAN